MVGFIIWAAGTAVNTIFKDLDIVSSRGLKPAGIKEKNKLFRDKDGWFSEPKAWIATILMAVVSFLLYWFIPETDGWKSWYITAAYAPSILQSWFHSRKNAKLIAASKVQRAAGDISTFNN